MSKYKPADIEKTWQSEWQKEKLFEATDFSKKTKYFTLIEFPYPSGVGLHVGHVRSWSAMDTYCRRKRMQGFNVLYPIGWDAFGLPAENYALKTGTHPSKVVPKNISNYKKQIKSLGLSFDWSREIDTTNPKYYKWTQWIFIQLFKQDLAYQAEVPVNWCPKCKTNLADEEVLENGCHERCGLPTERRMQKQWLLKITKYADRLLKDLDDVDYPEEIKSQQVNWIGRSEGATISFKVVDSKKVIEVFTTRPDTLCGTTFLVVSPDYEEINELIAKEQKEKAEKYIKQTRQLKGRNKEDKEKTGIFSGSYAINPATKKKIPIWISNYVVGGYGSGAIMAVPAHDERDWQFATKFKLPIVEVVQGGETEKQAYAGKGKIMNSDKWNGLFIPKDIDKVIFDLVKQGWGKKAVDYHLHDWIFSRQHYWGEPIPIIHCSKCGPVPVDEKDLPVKLPYLEKYEPSGTGESPLARVKDWVNTKCPKCGAKARRETDTMPNWAGSNWYFIRYLDSKNDKELASKKKMDYWLPVDLYQGGFEHTTLHLLYSRFIYKFLFDIKVVPTSEPYAKRRPHGIVLGPDGKKMSKSKGNVINPDEIVEKFGADSLRFYEMFMGPFDQTIAWSVESLEGCYRFLGRIWRLFQENLGQKTPKELSIKLQQTIKKVDSDIENMKFNTAVAALMEFSNFWNEKGKLSKDDAGSLVKLLTPFVPHFAEEIWVNVLKQPFSIQQQAWPEYDSKLIDKQKKMIVVQVNGKVRGQIEVEANKIDDQKQIENMVKVCPNVSKWLKKGKIRKTIYVPGKIVNFVVS